VLKRSTLFSNRMRVVWVLTAMAVTAALTFSMVRLAAAPKRIVVSGAASLAPLPTIDHPLAQGATQVPLSDAASTLGAPVVLPSTSLVKPSDAGPVWTASIHDSDTGESSGTVAVTFPTQSLIIKYTRPVPYSNPLDNYQGFVKDSPGAQVVYLNGVPALAIPQLPDGSNFGSIEFVLGGTMIAVMGHQDESALQAVAQSLMSRADTPAS